MCNFSPPPNDTLLYIEGAHHPKAHTTRTARIRIGREDGGRHLNGGALPFPNFVGAKKSKIVDRGIYIYI
jgi:hypothetical protein